MSDQEPKGFVIFFNEKRPVTWERETNRYVYNVKQLQKETHGWVKHKRNFEDKMDKQEIFNGDFEQTYIPIKYQKKMK